MFEGLVQKLLLDYLGTYVKDIPKEKLKIGLWNGELLLENVALIPEAFNYLQLPLALEEGRIGKLSIKIPWKKLGWDPIIIVLEDVFIHSRQRDDNEWSSESVESREYAGKKAKLAAAELAKLSRRVCENQAGQSFISHITAKILDGIQLSIRNVNVVYTGTARELAQFVFGLKFSSLTMKQEQNPLGSSIGKPRGGQVNKIVELSSLGVYCSTSPGTLHSMGSDISGDSQLWSKARLENNEFDYILVPFDVAVSLMVNRSGKLENGSPQYSISGELLTNLALRLNEIQMEHLLILWDYLCICPLREKYGHYRPWSYPVSRKQTGWQMKWWHYACNSVLSDVRKRLKKTSWRYLLCQKRYVSLYKKKLDILRQEKPVDEDTLQKLEQMEKEYNIDDILSYRSIAENESQDLNFSSTAHNMGKSGEIIIGIEKPQSDEGSSVRTRGWLNWLSLGMLGAGGTEDSMQFSGAVSDEVIKDIYEVTEFHPESSVEGSLQTMSRVFLSSIKFNIHQITANLHMKAQDMDIVKITFDEVLVECKFWEESWNILSNISSIVMDDLYTKQVILLPVIEENAPKSIKPFLTFQIEKLPASAESELSLKLVLQPFEVTYVSCFLLNILDFFGILGSFQLQQQRVLLSLNGFEDANSRLVSKAEYILSNRTKMMWDVSFSSIIIKVPWRQDSKLFVMGLETGTVTLRSSNEIGSPALESEDQHDNSLTNFICSTSTTEVPHVVQLQGLYDHYEIELSNFEMNVSLPDHDKPISILEKFNASIFLECCIIQDESALKQLEVRLSASSISVHMSPSLYGVYVGMIACLDIPKSKSESLIQKQNDSTAFHFFIAANLESFSFHADLEDDVENSSILILALEGFDVKYAFQDICHCFISSKTLRIRSDTCSGEIDLCLSQNLSVSSSVHGRDVGLGDVIQIDGERSTAADECFIFHYQAHRSLGEVCHHYTICLSDIDIHLYPNIIGLLLSICDRLSAYGTQSVPSYKNSPVRSKDTNESVLVSCFGLQSFGFSNFCDTESDALAGIPLVHFPFVTIDNSGSLGSLEGSLIHGIPGWRNVLNASNGKFVRSPSRKRSRKFSGSTFIEAFTAPREGRDVDLHVIDLNLNGLKVRFHDASCILGTLILPICKSSSVVDCMGCLDTLCSIEGILLSSPWSKQDCHEFLWGHSISNLSPILNIRLRKENEGMLRQKVEISFGIQHTCCVLPPEFLAILIGYFDLPDWTNNGNEKFDTGRNMQKDIEENNVFITLKFEILDSILVVPVERQKQQFLHLDLQQLYCSFTTKSDHATALKDIPPQCTVPSQKIAESVNLLNVFGRDISLSFSMLNNSGKASSKFDTDVRCGNMSLIAPLNADLWIRFPCEPKVVSGELHAPTCIMIQVHDCQVIAGGDYFACGMEAVLDAISQLSSIGQESKCFTSDVSQFLQLKKSLKEGILSCPDSSNVTFSEIRCCVYSLSTKLYQPRIMHSSELVAKADMQLKVSASLKNEIPLCVDVSFSSFYLHSFHTSVILLHCASEGSVSTGLDIHLMRSGQGVIELQISLPCAHIWLHLSDWDEVFKVLLSYSSQLAMISFMMESSKYSNLASRELDPDEIPIFQNDSESLSTTNFISSQDMEDSVDLIVKSENIGISFHVPVKSKNEAFDKLRDAEVKQAMPSYFSSDKLGEEALLSAKPGEYVAVTIQSNESKLVISGRDAVLSFGLEKAKGMFESIKNQEILSWPFIQLLHVHVVTEITSKQHKQHFNTEIQIDSLDVWLSHHLFYFWHSLQFEIPETGSSQSSYSNMDLKVQLQKASMLLTDGWWSSNGPLLEILLRNVLLNSITTESIMEIFVGSELLVNYNNIEKVMWEPFIESWSYQLNVIRKRKQSAFPNTSIVTDVNLTSLAQLNLNITEPVIEVVFRVTELITEVRDKVRMNNPPGSRWILGSKTTDGLYTRRYAPYILQNETSLPLVFQVYRGLVNADDYCILEVNKGDMVLPGCSVPIYIDESVQEQVLCFRPTQSLDTMNGKKLNGVMHHMISIQLEGTSGPSLPVSMDIVGLSYFEVSFSNASEKIQIEKCEDDPNYNMKIEEKSRKTPNSGFVVPVVLDVSIQRYSKLIRMCSTVKLLNATSVPLELRFDIPFGVSPKVLDPIYPGQEFPLPLLLAEAGRLRWRPLGNDFLWSEAHSLSNILSQENLPGFVRSFVCYPSHPSSDSFRCCISVEHITLPSSNGPKKGTSTHIKDSVEKSGQDGGKRLYSSEKSKRAFIHYVTLTTPLLIKNYLPMKVLLSIDSGGITRSISISEVNSASLFHVDSTHDLGLVFHVFGFNPSSSMFARAETFTTVARLHDSKFSLSENLILCPDSSHGSVNVVVEKVMDAFCGAREICIFAPFLLYNCTGLPLTVADSGYEMGGNGCYIPSCYHLTEMDQLLKRKHGLGLISPNWESHTELPNIYNIGNSFAKRTLTSLTEEVDKYLLPSQTRSFIGTDSSTYRLGNFDKQCTSSQLQDSEKVRLGSKFMNLDGRKITACMYSPVSNSTATDLTVRLSLRLPECITGNTKSSVWSSSFFLVPESGSTTVVIPRAFASGAYIISVMSSMLDGPLAGRTRAITFQPRYVICNACNKDLCYKQKGTNSMFHLGVEKHSHLYWADTTRELLISLRFNEPGWQWSGSFFPDHLGDTQVKLRNYVTGASKMVRVEVQNADVSVRDDKIIGNPHGNSGTHLILLSDDDTGFMPYRIDNFTKERLRIYQQKCETFETTVHSYTTCPYAWDEPCYPHRLVVEVLGERILGSYTLDDVKEHIPVYLPSTTEKPGRQLFISIHAEGTIKVLSIIDSNSHLLKDTTESGFSGFRDQKKFDQKDVFVEYSERISINISFIGISLIKSYPQPEELLFLSASETKIDLLQSVDQQKLCFQISSLQIDNQLRNTPYPVILSFRSDHGVSSAGQMNLKDVMPITSQKPCEPIFVLAAAKWRKKEMSLASFKYISIRLSALRLELEEEVILCLFDFVRTVILTMQSRTLPSVDLKWHTSERFQDNHLFNVHRGQVFSMDSSRLQEVCRTNPSLPSVVPIGAPWQQIYLLARRQKKVYVEVFDLAPIKLTLSFSSAPWMLRNNGPASAKSLARVGGTAFQRSLIALADVEEAPVYLKQLTITHHMGSWQAFQEILIRHYTRNVLHEMYKVFGSAGVIGNPMGFARILGLGIKDFLSDPVRGILQSPAGLFTGMAHGTSSLLSNTVYAISNATTQFSKSAHKSIVAFTFDEQAVSKMEKQQKGFASHSKGVLNEFLEGLTGFLQSPIRGAEKHGLPGVLSGIALGTAGLVARPVASILDVTWKTAQSIRNRSSLHRPNRFRARIPRPLTRDLPLRPYSWEEAIGTSILLEADDAKLKDEIFVICKALKQSGKFVVITNKLLLVVMCSSLVGLGTPEFRGVADPEWLIEVEMGLATVIHVGREMEVLTIVGSSSEVQLKQHQHKKGVTKKGHSNALPLSHISIELAGEEAAEGALQVLLSAIEQGNVEGWGTQVLHRSNLR